MTIVSTTAGKLEGLQERGLHVFRGIPFAQAPVGKLRFRAPLPHASWSGVREAKVAGAAAPQVKGMMQDIGEPQEDCLFLNVWTPAVDNRRRPVFVWMHGGGFSTGSGTQVMYDGGAMASRGDVVVVTINYRLGALGFANLTDLLGDAHDATANNGVRDQIAALHWVRDNIDGFGGDPECVTIAGESAGGMSIGTLVATKQAHGLYHRAIAQSGASHHATDGSESTRITELLLRTLDVDPGSPDKLWELPFGAIVEAQQACGRQTVLRGPSGRQLPQGGMTLIPTVDGDLLDRQPFEILEAGEGARVPLMVGTTLEEWNFFVLLTDPKRLRIDEAGLRATSLRRIGEQGAQAVDLYRGAIDGGGDLEPWRIFSAIETDRMFRIPAIRMAEAHAAHSDTFMYLFDWQSPLMEGRLGACHAIDIPFVFDSLGSQFGKAFVGEDADAAVLGGQTMRAWLEFTRTGMPAHDALGAWPAYDVERRRTMYLARHCELRTDPMGVQRAFWDGIT